jgi:hypothetical protein
MKDRSKIRDPDLRHVDAALRRAAAKACEQGVRAGIPVWVMRDWKLIDLTAEANQGQAGQVAKESSDAETAQKIG